MKPILLLLPLLLAAAPDATKDAGKEATEAKAEAPGEPGRVPEGRITVVDSRDMPSDVEEESRVLKGAEMQEIIRISRHRGNYGQLMLYSSPWRGPILWGPGGVIYLETEKGRKKREAAAAAAKNPQEEAAEDAEQEGKTRAGPELENP